MTYDWQGLLSDRESLALSYWLRQEAADFGYELPEPVGRPPQRARAAQALRYLRFVLRYEVGIG